MIATLRRLRYETEQKLERRYISELELAFQILSQVGIIKWENQEPSNESPMLTLAQNVSFPEGRRDVVSLEAKMVVEIHDGILSVNGREIAPVSRLSLTAQRIILEDACHD